MTRDETIRRLVDILPSVENHDREIGDIAYALIEHGGPGEIEDVMMELYGIDEELGEVWYRRVADIHLAAQEADVQ